MVARGISGAVGQDRIPNNVTEDLNDAHGILVIESCERAHAGASTVDAERGDDRWTADGFFQT